MRNINESTFEAMVDTLVITIESLAEEAAKVEMGTPSHTGYLQREAIAKDTLYVILESDQAMTEGLCEDLVTSVSTIFGDYSQVSYYDKFIRYRGDMAWEATHILS